MSSPGRRNRYRGERALPYSPPRGGSSPPRGRRGRYGRPQRSRSRSPRRSPVRRRSRSPPRRHSGGMRSPDRSPPRRRSPPRGRDRHSSGPKKLLSFREFMMDQPDWVGPADGEKRYEEYKANFGKSQKRIFFDAHRSEAWMKEIYHPTFVKATIDMRKAEAQAALGKFLSSFPQAVTDGSLSCEKETEATFKKEDTPLEKSNEQADEAEKSAGGSENEDSKADDQEESNAEPPADGEDSTATVVFLPSLPPHVSRADLEALLKEQDGFQRLDLSGATPERSFHRLGWAFFETPENAQSALKPLDGKSINDFSLSTALHVERPSPSHPRVAPASWSVPAQLESDLQRATRLTKTLDKSLELENTIFEASTFTDLAVPHQLDVLLHYLRNVHNYCYYCAMQCETNIKLTKRCPSHYRRPVPETAEGEEWHPSENDRNHVKKMTSKVTAFLERFPNTQLETEEALSAKWTLKWKEKHCKQLEADRFRCTLCSKLFKGEHFVFKHLSLKHPDEEKQIHIDAIEEQYFLNFERRPPPGFRNGVPMAKPGYGDSRGRGRGGRGGGGDRGRGARGRGRGRGRGAGGTPDPRAGNLFSYRDLDAPRATMPVIDYRTALKSYADLQKK